MRVLRCWLDRAVDIEAITTRRGTISAQAREREHDHARVHEPQDFEIVGIFVRALFEDSVTVGDETLLAKEYVKAGGKPDSI